MFLSLLFLAIYLVELAIYTLQMPPVPRAAHVCPGVVQYCVHTALGRLRDSTWAAFQCEKV